MIWSALLHPIGPEPVGVYWVRRFVVCLGLLFGLLFVVWLWPSGGAHRPAATVGRSATPRPARTPAASGQPTAQPGGNTASGLMCAASDLTVSADADATNYPAGVEPHITISVKNISTNTCRLDVGPSARFLTVSSGSDHVWSSADCGGTGSDLITLAPGVVAAHTYVWPRHRSQPGCPAAANGTASPPGTYLAQAHAGGVTTPGAVIHLVS